MAKQILDTIDSILNIHAGKPGVIVGSGPSTNQTDLSVYKDHIIVAVGQAVTAIDKCNYFCMCDGSTIESSFWERAQAISGKCVGFGSGYLGYVNENLWVFPRDHSASYKFSMNDKKIIWGIDITHPTIHWTYLLGIRNVTLIGIDYRYDNGRKYCIPTKQPGKVTWGRNSLADIRGSNPNGSDDPVFSRSINMWKEIINLNKDLKITTNNFSQLYNFLKEG